MVDMIWTRRESTVNPADPTTLVTWTGVLGLVRITLTEFQGVVTGARRDIPADGGATKMSELDPIIANELHTALELKNHAEMELAAVLTSDEEIDAREAEIAERSAWGRADYEAAEERLSDYE
jgi:hypothetical protein